MVELLSCDWKCIENQNSVQVRAEMVTTISIFNMVSSCFIQMKTMIAMAADIFVHQVTRLHVNVYALILKIK